MAMVEDIGEIDVRVLNQAVNEGVRYAKKKSPVITGHFRKNWRSAPAVRSKTGEATKVLVNNADYAAYVNYGHRAVDKAGNKKQGWRSSAGAHGKLCG